MKESFKGPLFFCEHCGSPVPQKAKQCPTCGRFFASVRCPSCGFTGSEELFSEGCPICGYSRGKQEPHAADIYRDKIPSYRTPRGPVAPLPWWVYGISLFALLVAIATILYVMI